MSDFDLMAVAVLPIALAFAWSARNRRLSGFDVCVTAAIFVAGMMFVSMVGHSLGATIAACVPMLVLLPWALVPLPKGLIGGYDIWAMMSSVAMIDTSQSPRIEQGLPEEKQSDVSEEG